jgi:two-component system chemotaxis response regulator CheB
MQTPRIVVIGASAGGIEAARAIATELPRDFPAPICLVIHIPPESPSLLPEIIDRAGALTAVTAYDGASLKPGHIYLPPPDHHLVVDPGRLRVTRGPRENRFRPAIDPLFRSAAQVYGPAAIGVILTGNLDDGSAGLWAIQQLGGVTIVQDPADARFPSMPRSALATVTPRHCIPLARIPAVLEAVVSAPLGAREEVPVPDHVRVEVNIAKGDHPLDAGLEDLGAASPYACPECHGVLLALKHEGRTRFRCHTGHAYSAESLLAAIREKTEESLWQTIRALEEGMRFIQHVIGHRSHGGDPDDATRLRSAADQMRAQADALRALIVNEQPATP